MRIQLFTSAAWHEFEFRCHQRPRTMRGIYWRLANKHCQLRDVRFLTECIGTSFTGRFDKLRGRPWQLQKTITVILCILWSRGNNALFARGAQGISSGCTTGNHFKYLLRSKLRSSEFLPAFACSTPSKNSVPKSGRNPRSTIYCHFGRATRRFSTCTTG